MEVNLYVIMAGTCLEMQTSHNECWLLYIMENSCPSDGPKVDTEYVQDRYEIEV